MTTSRSVTSCLSTCAFSVFLSESNTVGGRITSKCCLHCLQPRKGSCCLPLQIPLTFSVPAMPWASWVMGDHGTGVTKDARSFFNSPFSLDPTLLEGSSFYDYLPTYLCFPIGMFSNLEGLNNENSRKLDLLQCITLPAHKSATLPAQGGLYLQGNQ